MKKTEGAFSRKKPGPALYQITVAPESPRAVVAILHGYADHAARYAHVQDAWAEKGIGSVAVDMRGHGRAEGARGSCRRFDEYLDDASELVPLLEAAFPKLPVFLFGHSFGGLVAAHVALRAPAPYRGVLLSDPYLRLALEVPAAKVMLGKLASRVAPSLGIPSGLAGSSVTHDAKVARAYDEDPLVFKKANVRWFTEATKAQEAAFIMAPKLALPLYMGLGTADGVASPDGGRVFFAAAGSKDKTKHEWEGMFHEILMEIEWRGVADAMADWVLERA